MTKKTLIILSLIFTLGFFLRFYHLNLNLPELYIDETAGQYLMRMSVLYPDHNQSYSIQRFLVNTLSFTWVLGLNPFGARSASAFFSSLISLAIFIFFKQIKHKYNLQIALLGALLSTILPWSFLIGRIGHVHIPIIVSLICLSSLYFLKAKLLRDYFYSLFFLGLAAFYYPTIIFIAPFISFLTLYSATQNLGKKQRRQLIFAIFALGLVVLTIFFFKYRGLDQSGRGADLAIWRDPNTLHDTNTYRGLSWLSQSDALSFFFDPKQVSPFVYNKVTGNLAVFTRNYLSFFSPDWLFLRGDAILRHSTGQMGYFFPVLIPFLLFGTVQFFKNADKKTQSLFVVWILASPLAAAITKDGAGYLLRGITLLPFLTYFISLGIIDSIDLFKSRFSKHVYIAILTFLVSYSAFYFFYGYFHVYPYQTSTARAYEYGFKDLSDFQVENNHATLLIIWDGYYPFGHFVFWQNIPAQEYAGYKFEDIVVGESHFNHPRSNLYFVKPYKTDDVKEFIQQYKPNYLVIPDPYYVHYPKELLETVSEPIKVINYPSGEQNFTIYRL